MASKRKPRAIDLFCGAGGMSLGFEQAGFDIVAAADIDPVHVETYRKNFVHTRAHTVDLSAVCGDELRSLADIPASIDVVFGGPPCQGFSLIGKREINDPRNHLTYHFGRLVVQLNPRYFVLENVPGILATTTRSILARFLHLMRSSGYRVLTPIQVLDASDYLVPQRRRRAFILGYRKGELPPSYPTPERPCPITDLSVWSAISDLAAIDDCDKLEASDECSWNGSPSSPYVRLIEHRLGNGSRTNSLSGCRRTVHSPSTIRRFAATPVGTSEPISRFFRLDPDGYAHSLRAGTGPDKGSFSAPRPIHPNYPRCITVREGARLHSYPDWFQFHPTIWHGFRQIGNSVPPMMALAVGNSIRQALER